MDNLFAPDSGWGNYALKGLRELQIPEQVPLWPQTLGWWLVLAGLLFWMFRYCLKLSKRYWRNRYRRLAIQQLSVLRLRISAGDNSGLRLLPELVKATALQSFPRTDVASLYGDEWEEFLDSSYSGVSFKQRFPGLLYTLSYQSFDGRESPLSDEFWRQITNWVRTHRAAYD